MHILKEIKITDLDDWDYACWIKTSTRKFSMYSAWEMIRKMGDEKDEYRKI